MFTQAPITLDAGLTPAQVWQIARGARLEISVQAQQRVHQSRLLVADVVAQGLRVYGVSTGVGMLSDTAVSPELQRQLSRNLVLSHAAGIGEPISRTEVRAIMACAITNHCHGYSGVRWEVVQALTGLLNADCIPVVPRQGSVGYVSHMAHIGLTVIGQGEAWVQGHRVSGAQALALAGLAPLELEAKEGLSLIGSAPCAAGLACVALAQTKALLDWAHATAALSFEALRGQLSVFDPTALAFRRADGIARSGQLMRQWLEGSAVLAQAQGRKTQDALTLRAIPQVYGALFDVIAHVETVLARELESATDNPLLVRRDDGLQVMAVAHGVASGLGLVMEYLGTSVSQVGIMSERRLDRLVNPLVSGLPPFLAEPGGVSSGFMIAQYTALSLTGENRRLAAPAALDAGVTSGLQEDVLCHATPSALKTVQIVTNTRRIVAIELLAALQASEFCEQPLAPHTAALRHTLRQQIAPFHDDRPLSKDMEAMARWMASNNPSPAEWGRFD